MKGEKVVIFGDTSAFHQFSALNYAAFRALVAAKFDIVASYDYRHFPVDRPAYDETVARLERDAALQLHLDTAEVVIVHGEGLLEREAGYAWPYLHLVRYLKARARAAVWLVNFCMYEPEPYADYVSMFDYVACRDELTAERLQRVGIESELSFDCSVLAVDAIPALPDAGWAALIRGRFEFHVDPAIPVRKLDCCWAWNDPRSYRFGSAAEVLPFLGGASVCYTSSFHGCIASYLSGVAFVVVDRDGDNPKYRSVERDLLGTSAAADRLGREALRDAYTSRLPELQRRARRNLP
jgi:hypothetical protein